MKQMNVKAALYKLWARGGRCWVQSRRKGSLEHHWSRQPCSSSPLESLDVVPGILLSDILGLLRHIILKSKCLDLWLGWSKAQISLHISLSTRRKGYRSRQYYESKVLHNTQVTWFSTFRHALKTDKFLLQRCQKKRYEWGYNIL